MRAARAARAACPAGATRPPNTTRIEACACARTYPDGTVALAPLDLDVAPAEMVVLVGPSGCGKITLLRILSGLDRPDPGGVVLYDGADVTPVPIERRRVGMVFQFHALFPNMTVAGDVAYGPRLRGLSRTDAAAKAGRCLELCRIAPLADRRIDQLSGGQRQRVALARALAAAPRAIFLDEPLTALDAALRETLREEIADLLRGQGVTAVYGTHEQAEAMALADRILVVSNGRIEQAADPRTIHEAPATRFVATFVGETNEVDGALHRPGATRLLSAGEGLPATVLRATFLGASTRLELETDAGDRLIAHDHDHAARRLAPDDRIGVRLDRAAAPRPET